MERKVTDLGVFSYWDAKENSRKRKKKLPWVPSKTFPSKRKVTDLGVFSRWDAQENSKKRKKNYMGPTKNFSIHICEEN